MLGFIDLEAIHELAVVNVLIEKHEEKQLEKKIEKIIEKKLKEKNEKEEK
ncbi:unnamed protein product [marine sediment metagenome]|uniref:Uncharacterized protein n=1 Tax=marine sediment metagenome TaxID=412755 RepID=X1LEP9_9ZZZZ